jgi:cystathionine gamma-synthase/methionine-gamma-lyase
LSTLHLDTLAVHAGEAETRPRPSATPIYTASSYAYETTDDLDAAFRGAGAFYSRNGNPTTEAFENACAALEGADGAVAFGSGMAALHGALFAAGLKAGDSIVAARDLYGVTVRLLNEVLGASGVSTVYVDSTDLDAVRAAVSGSGPKALLVESVSNPLLKLANVAALAEIAHAAGATLIVDNTFASPALLQPLALGADMAMHSATKYLGGHGDALGGVVCAGAPFLKPLKTASVVVGAVLAPFEAAFLLRGIKTLALRMERHSSNALAVAQWLQSRADIARVYYPGLASHPQATLAASLFGGRGFGGMVSFDLARADRATASRFIDGLKLALPGPTLGDVETLVMYPAIASHRSFTAEQRAELGIGDGLIRLSVGIEHPADILADLEGSLNALAHR